MLDIADVTPPVYSLLYTTPQEGQEYASLSIVRISCHDPETPIHLVDFHVTIENKVRHYHLAFDSYRYETGTQQWEVWQGTLDQPLTTPGTYEYWFHLENDRRFGTDTDIMTFTINPTPEDFGNLSVTGFNNSEPVVFECWYEYEDVYPIYASEHRTISLEGYTWADLKAGIYSVHGIFEGILTVSCAVVEPEQTTHIQLNFVAESEEYTAPSEPFDVTLLFFGVGGLAIFYGFLKQKKVKT